MPGCDSNLAMRSEPSPNLVQLLERLELATPEQVRSVAQRVTRLAAGLPEFESVWIDALAHARVLTAYQAAEINAGRADALVQGPYILLRPLPGPHFAACFAARAQKSGQVERLYVARRTQRTTQELAAGLKQLVERSKPLESSDYHVVEEAGTMGSGAWAVCAPVRGTTAADWMVENGRFAPAGVWHMAREIASRLEALERHGIVHGDLGASGLFVDDAGRVALPMAGLRGVVRPSEGYGFGDMPTEAYDYLAPERVADGSPPNVASDIYAFGCLLWHLLTGRPPLAGGNALAKLKSAHAGKIVDVRQLAPEVPQALAHAIDCCLAHEPAARPESFKALANLLGPKARGAAGAVSRAMRQPSYAWYRSPSTRTQRGLMARKTPLASLVAAGLLVSAIALWPVWHARTIPSVASVAGKKLLAAKNTPKPVPVTESSRQESAPGTPRPEAPAIKLVAATAPIAPLGPADLLLPTDKKLRLTRLEVKSGQRVRGQGDLRAAVSVPAEGLVLVGDEVCFEGVDFIWEESASVAQAPRRGGAMVVEAQSLEFKDCSFTATSELPPLAIVWMRAGKENSAELALTNCLCNGLAALVDVRAGGRFSAEIRNVLVVDSGPLVRLNRMPKAEESIELSLERTTLRGDCAVVECRYARREEPLGTITISATDSVIDTSAQSALLVFTSAESPGKLLAATSWGGQSSLLTPHTAVALWRGGPKKLQVLPEDELEVAGLVRSDVEFVGKADGPPSESRIRRWQGPLRSAEPPGAEVGLLPIPRR
jgi:eukaryotic-like serine/threonine-protein kinase